MFCIVIVILSGRSGLRSLLLLPEVQLLAILVLALATRIAVLLSLARFPWFSYPLAADASVYDSMARAFARGDYLIGTEPLRMSPAYPFLAGAVYRLLGDGPWAIRCVQAVFGLILVAATWDTARRLLNPTAAAVAGVAVALFGPLLFHEAQILADAPAAALAAVALWATIRAMVRGEERPSRWTLVGLVTGVVGLFRPNAVLLVVPLLVGSLWTRPGRNRGWRVGAALIGFLLGLSPTPVRNVLATGHPTLFAAHGGINLYVGNGPGATGSFNVPAEMPQANAPRSQFAVFHEVAERDLGRPLSEEAADRYWTDRTLAYVSEHPMQWIRLAMVKVRLFWTSSSISDMVHYQFTRTLDPVLRLPLIQWSVLMPFALVGTLLALRRPGPGAVVGLFNLAWCASLVIVFVVDRYRLPALSGLAIAAVLVVWEFPETWAVASRAGKTGLLVLVAVCLWMVRPVVGRDGDQGMEWWRLGTEFEYAGRFEEARAAYSRSLQIAPGNEFARARLKALGGPDTRPSKALH